MSRKGNAYQSALPTTDASMLSNAERRSGLAIKANEKDDDDKKKRERPNRLTRSKACRADGSRQTRINDKQTPHGNEKCNEDNEDNSIVVQTLCLSFHEAPVNGNNNGDCGASGEPPPSFPSNDVEFGELGDCVYDEIGGGNDASSMELPKGGDNDKNMNREEEEEKTLLYKMPRRGKKKEKKE